MKICHTVFTLLAAITSFGLQAAETFEYGDYDDTKLTCTLTKYNGGDTEELTIPNNHKKGNKTYKVNRVARKVFNGIKSLKTVNIGPYLDIIGGTSSAEADMYLKNIDNFFSCSNLEKFVVNSNNGHFRSTNGGMLVSADAKKVWRVPPKMTVTSGTLTLPASLERIAPQAFSGNSTVSKLVIGANVIQIACGGGLSRMSNLETIEVSDKNPYYLVTKDGVLMHVSTYAGVASVLCVPRRTALTSYKIPSTINPSGTSIKVTGIGDFAFENVTRLKSITIGSNVRTIGIQAFANSGISDITVPVGVSTFQDGTFYACASLTNILIQGSEVHIPDNFARNCRALTKVSLDGDIPVRIGNAAFKNCSSLTSFPLSAHTDMYGDSIFANTGFTSIEFRGGLKESYSEPGKAMFTGCKNLKSIDMSAISFDSGDYYPFYKGFATNCPQLSSITFPSHAALYAESFGVNNNLKTIILNNFSMQEGPVFAYDEDASPRVYIVSAKTYPLTESESGNLVKGVNGARVTPTIYMDAFTPDPEDETGDNGTPMAGAIYFVPGSTLREYSGYPNLKESYTIKLTNVNGKAQVTFRPAFSNVVIKSVNLGYGSITVPSNGVVKSSVDYAKVKTVFVSYSINGVDMLTKYPQNYLTTDVSGIDSVDAADADTVTVVDVYSTTGTLLRQGVVAGEATDGLEPGIYIVGGNKVLVK